MHIFRGVQLLKTELLPHWVIEREQVRRRILCKVRIHRNLCIFNVISWNDKESNVVQRRNEKE